jgi:hypothetical protein
VDPGAHVTPLQLHVAPRSQVIEHEEAEHAIAHVDETSQWSTAALALLTSISQLDETHESSGAGVWLAVTRHTDDVQVTVSLPPEPLTETSHVEPSHVVLELSMLSKLSAHAALFEHVAVALTP